MVMPLYGTYKLITAVISEIDTQKTVVINKIDTSKSEISNILGTPSNQTISQDIADVSSEIGTTISENITEVLDKRSVYRT